VGLIDEKTRGRKSRATVPLRNVMLYLCRGTKHANSLVGEILKTKSKGYQGLEKHRILLLLILPKSMIQKFGSHVWTCL
jgi:hypothetical protein